MFKISRQIVTFGGYTDESLLCVDFETRHHDFRQSFNMGSYEPVGPFGDLTQALDYLTKHMGLNVTKVILGVKKWHGTSNKQDACAYPLARVFVDGDHYADIEPISWNGVYT